MVGSANGRSMTELITALPGKSSRTRTQATSTPVTTLMAVASSDIHSVRTRADFACGDVMAGQNRSVAAFAVNAAIGRATMNDRERIVTPGRSAADSRGRATGRPPRTRVASATRDAQLILDLGDGAVVRVEECLVHRRPTAEVIDGEQGLRVRELRLVEV